MNIVCTACECAVTPELAIHPCPACGEPVEVRYSPGEIDPVAALRGRGTVWPRRLGTAWPGRQGMTERGESRQTATRRGADLPGTTEHVGRRLAGILSDFSTVLPLPDPEHWLSLGEGRTPLIPLPRLARKLGIPHLYLKNEGANPTGSFKDRGTAVALSRATATGARRVGTVSSGNMAASVAAYAARAGLPCDVLVPAHLRPDKIAAIAVTRPRLYRVEGDYGDIYRQALELGRKLGIYFAVSDDPYRVEGQKTTAYEIVRSLGTAPGRRGWFSPTHVFVPTSAGGHAAALLKAFDEMLMYGAIDEFPAVVSVQADGCAPIARAFERGERRITRLTGISTSAHAIANPDPPSGGRLLRELARPGRGGGAIAVPDEAMREAQFMLAADEGIFTQMEAAAALAGAIEYRSARRLDRHSVVVLVATGNGLKDLATFAPGDFPVVDLPLRELEAHLAPYPEPRDWPEMTNRTRRED
jgi:threonine synthase